MAAFERVSPKVGERSPELAAYAQRARLGAWAVIASNLLFAVTDVRLAGEAWTQVTLLKLLQLAAAVALLLALPRLRTRAALTAAAFAFSIAVLGVVAVSGGVSGDLATTAILCIAFAWGTATLLPWGPGAQAAQAAVSAAAIVLNVLLVTHGLALLYSYTAVAVGLALAVSVLLAAELQRQRRALAAADAATRRAGEALEARVQERTAALETANARLQETAAALATSEQRFRRVSELTSDYAYCFRINPDRTARIEWVTEAAFARITGYSPRELERRGGTAALVHPEDLGIVWQRYEALIAGRHDVSEFRIVRRDGAVRWLREHGYGEWDAGAQRVTRIFGAVQDITAHRRAEEALRQSEAQYRLLFEDNPCPLAVFDRETLRFLSVNAAALRCYGYSRDEILAMAVTDIRPAEPLPPSRRELPLGSPASLIGTWRHLTKSGAVIEVEVTAAELTFGDRPAVLVQANDVTQRRAAEQEVHRLNGELEQRVQERTEQLRAVNRELEAFSYTVSHDLTAPLRHITAFAAILSEDHAHALAPDGRQALDRVRAAAQRMERLIGGLLTLSGVSRAELHQVRIDLSQMAAEILAELRATEPQRHVTWRIQPGLSVRGDPALLQVALQNLLGNAWKYTARHAAAHIEVGSRTVGERIAFFVRDDGAGFDMAFAGTLFAPFRRLHSTAEFEGSGIGLATVQRIIQRHGGEVWAEAAVEKGATLYFSLPDAHVESDGDAAPGTARRALRATRQRDAA